jgi:hypothetical protein
MLRPRLRATIVSGRAKGRQVQRTGIGTIRQPEKRYTRISIMLRRLGLIGIGKIRTAIGGGYFLTEAPRKSNLYRTRDFGAREK